MTKVQSSHGALRTERLPNGNRKLLRALTVKLNDGTRITVSQDFETDFSSIPWFARSAIDWSRVDVAGVVHDYLYWCPKQANRLRIDRARADEIWWELAGSGQHCANAVQRWLGWAGLRAFGGWAFRHARETGGRVC